MFSTVLTPGCIGVPWLVMDVAALAALAAELPAAVLAKLLNLNINTANAWAAYAQHDWTTYLTTRTRSRGRTDFD
jgi:hypothetical protein